MVARPCGVLHFKCHYVSDRTMNSRNRLWPSPGHICQPGSFLHQPPRVLIVDASPPCWSEIGFLLCDALDNFLTLASCLDGPIRLPLLSVYAVNLQLECLLPFVQVKGNLLRLSSCVEELRSLPMEGCTHPRGEMLTQAVLDSLQQFKQYMQHTSSRESSSTVEVTVFTSKPGQAVVRQLEEGLKNSDLGSLRRLLVVQISIHRSLSEGEPTWSPDTPSPEALGDTEENLMLGVEVDLQVIDSSVVAVESVLKAWLHDQAGDREHLYLLLPPLLGANESSSSNSKNNNVCLKCDIQERLLSPALVSGPPGIGAKTESVQDFLPPSKSQNPQPLRLRVIKSLQAEGVCESVLYGLPLLIRPTVSWQLDWDDIESNQQLFQALCHTLRARQWFLLARSEASSFPGPAISSHYVLQPSATLPILLLKPVVTRELLLPSSMSDFSQDPSLSTLMTVESLLMQLEEDPVFNPLCLVGNLYPYLRQRGLTPRFGHHYRGLGLRPALGQRRDPPWPTEGPMPRQPHGQQATGRAKATVAPLLTGPPSKVTRPALTLSCTAPCAPSLCREEGDELLMRL
ncbi:meiosis 1 arrest protein isoform X3 [Denticeps clupeoides]|nr:meiosis 1 arrest protein isoform X3 [Denticeps clupeoides]XP_028855083.1 meiosis 1 arrest protein isoform X3 [Denticeps clupeoides]